MTISMPSGTLPDNVHTRFRMQLTLETIYNKQHGKIYYAVFGWRKHIHGLKGGSLMGVIFALLLACHSWPIVITTMNELVQLSASCLLFSRHGKGLMTVSTRCWLNLAQERAWQVRRENYSLDFATFIFWGRQRPEDILTGLRFSQCVCRTLLFLLGMLLLIFPIDLWHCRICSWSSHRSLMQVYLGPVTPRDF